MKLQDINKKVIRELVNYTCAKLDEYINCSSIIYGADLHHEIFNTDYYIIGYLKAEKWLEKNVGILNAINVIKEYETFIFGNVSTDFTNAEDIVNMYVYIVGEIILQESDTLNEKWNEYLDVSDYKKIKREIKKSLLKN